MGRLAAAAEVGGQPDAVIGPMVVGLADADVIVMIHDQLAVDPGLQPRAGGLADRVGSHANLELIPAPADDAQLFPARLVGLVADIGGFARLPGAWFDIHLRAVDVEIGSTFRDLGLVRGPDEEADSVGADAVALGIRSEERGCRATRQLSS